MIPTLHIHLLGDFLLISGETPVTTITVPRVQSLLAYLVLHRGAPQDRSHLALLLWPDSTEMQAHTNLRQLLYHLRQSLPDADQFLHADTHSMQWLPTQPGASWTLDVQEVEEAFAQAEQAEQYLHAPVKRVKKRWCEDSRNCGSGVWCVNKAQKWPRPMTLAMTSSASRSMFP